MNRPAAVPHAMLDSCRRSDPRETHAPHTWAVIKVRAPALKIHGPDDRFLRPCALNGTWQRVDNTGTEVTLPHVGQFVLRDAPTQVIPVGRNWLAH